MKAQILEYYRQLQQDKIDVLRDMIAGLAEDAQNDAKGSAGDKHETALSMMHLEQEKLTQKLREVLAQKAILDKIDASKKHHKIALGSLIRANGMWLFVCAALPKINFESKTIIAVSPQSPLGQSLLGHEEGYSFNIGNTHYLVEEVS